jgi:hypothetical protein
MRQDFSFINRKYRLNLLVKKLNVKNELSYQLHLKCGMKEPK